MNTLSKEAKKAWAQTFFSVLVLWAWNNLSLHYAGATLHANPVVYSCAAFVSSALVLMFIGGHGSLMRETFRSLDTWLYGIILFINYVLLINLFSLVSSTEGSMIQRMSLIFSLLGSWLFFSRKPTPYKLLGGGVIVAGIVLVASGLPHDIRSSVYVIVLFSGLAEAARVFSAELHRPNAMANAVKNDPYVRCRVVGIVMFVVSLIFLTLTLSVAFLQGDDSHAIIKGFPQLKNFYHGPSILAGMAAGIFIIAPVRFIEFNATPVIKTENFLAVTSLSSVATLGWEWATQGLTGFGVSAFSGTNILACVLVTVGGLIMTSSQILKKKSSEDLWREYLTYQPQNIHAVEETHDIHTHAMEHFKGNTTQAARALKLPENVLCILQADIKKEMAFTATTLKEINKQYKKNILQTDPLTGLPNRTIFLQNLKKAVATAKPFTVFYLDLNKFKPVNDTYGHEAGDEILIGIAKRLKAIAPKGSTVTRIGGDEFCLAVPLPKAEATRFTRTLKTSVNKPFTITGIEATLSVTASIGSASFPQDGSSPEALIEAADGGMFGVKHTKEK